MPYPSILLHPSLESSSSLNNFDGPRPSLFDSKDDFIARMAPIGMAAIYFGGFSLAPQDPALSRQALLKLSFAHRHYLHPAGVRFQVQRQTATISGSVTTQSLATLAEILAHQIEGIVQVKNETEASLADQPAVSSEMEAVQLLLATDQSLRSQVQVTQEGDTLRLSGSVGSESQKNWAEQLVRAVGAEVISELQVVPTIESALKATQVDDESLQALVLYRLRLVRETEHLPLKVKANRGILTLHGKVRTEALRQRVENIARATLGLRELRSSLTIAP
jgi:osmotically-inducible protein OsmY